MPCISLAWCETLELVAGRLPGSGSMERETAQEGHVNRAKKGRKGAQRVLASAHCWAPILVEWKSGQEEESNAIWGGLLDTIVCQMHPAIEDLKDVPYPEAQSTPRF